MSAKPECVTSEDGSRRTTPGSWYHNGDWRELGSYEVNEARRLRYILATEMADCVPTGPLTGNPDWNCSTANNRAALHDIVDEICREDLRALYEVGHLLFASHQNGQGYRQSRVWLLARSVSVLKAAGFEELADEGNLAVAQAELLLGQADGERQTAIKTVEGLLDDAWQPGQRQD